MLDSLLETVMLGLRNSFHLPGLHVGATSVLATSDRLCLLTFALFWYDKV